MPNMTTAPFVVSQDGKMLKERRFHRKCYVVFSRLQQHGIPAITSMFENINPISHRKKKPISDRKKKPNHKDTEDSESEYNPSHDDSGEGDQFKCDNAKGSKDTDRRTIDMAPGGIKPRYKRVFADQLTPRNTRSRKSIAEPNTNLTLSDNYVGDNFDGHRQANVEANGLVQLDKTHTTNGGDSIAEQDGHNQIDNEDDGLVQIDGSMTNEGEGITQRGGENQMANKGVKERWEMGVNMGYGLQRMNRARRGKLPVVILEGRIRPVVPIVAAKFATECNIVVRNHVPVLKHWKDYKKQPGLFDMFKGKLSAKLDINMSDATVEKACSQMMRNAILQQRYRLKKYFDPFPLHLFSSFPRSRSCSRRFLRARVSSKSKSQH